MLFYSIYVGQFDMGWESWIIGLFEHANIRVWVHIKVHNNVVIVCTLMLLPVTSNYLETAAGGGEVGGGMQLMLSLPGVQLCYWWAVLQAALHTIATLQQLHSSSCQLHSYSWPGLVLGWCGRGGPGQQLQPSHLYRYHPRQMGGKIVHSSHFMF